MFTDAEDEKVNIFTKYPIVENIPIESLEKESEKIEKDSGLVIYYTETDDLEAEFEKIISLYNIIPIIRNKRAKIIQMKPFKNINLYMVVDPNFSDDQTCNYRKIQELCTTFNIEFKNQTFNGLISEVRTNFYDKTTKRHKFSKAEREAYFAKSQQCNQCHKEVKINSFHLDHIKALGNGGTNEESNIQMLCIGCHLDKTNCEREDGYVKLKDTESSFNNETREIFNSKQYGSYAFVDNYGERLNKEVFGKVQKYKDLDIENHNMYYIKKVVDIQGD